jgi:putative endonuclease
LFQGLFLIVIKKYYVYILSNFERTTFYIGVTNEISRRLGEHKLEGGSQFTSKYKCKYLVYYELFENINEAISREKQLKN